MLGLALEGGGAKGSFHMGVVKALLEEGYTFDIVAGTSIGALNAALIAQGDFELGYSLWENMTTSSLFDIEDIKLENILNNKIDLDTLTYATSKITEFIANKGLDTSKIKLLLDQYINEDKLRASPVDLGIITVSLSDLKPLELYKENIPYGKVASYLMASANFPLFKQEPLEGKYFLDGGIYDNCPINLLVKKGCTKVIAIRTFGIGFSQKTISSDIPIVSILPSEDLGTTLIFDNALIQRNLKMGYYDAKRALYGLKGKKYYITPTDSSFFLQALLLLTQAAILQISNSLSLSAYNTMNPTRLLFEKILPKLSRLLKLGDSASYEDLIIALLEPLAERRAVQRFEIYTFNQFMSLLIKDGLYNEHPVPKKSHLLKIGLEFIEVLAQLTA